MENDGISGFGPDFRAVPQEGIEAQFLPGNICGHGAGCIVYRVMHGGVQVAVKRLVEHQRLNAAFIAAYRKEFEIGRRLRHDALPVYRELRADSEEVYIVMDYIDGLTLDQFLATPDGCAYLKNENNFREFLSQLLDVIAYMHRSGVVHCDLKPSNIMLRHSDRHLMLLDLDKAYADTHNLTHGGTPGFSNALPASVKPSADKDFAAIASIMDFIRARCNKSAPRRFRRFRKMCEMPGISAAGLRRALPAQGMQAKIVVATVAASVLIITAGVSLFSYVSKDMTEHQKPLIKDAVDDDKEQGKTVIVSASDSYAPSASTMPTHGQPAAGNDAITDLDSRMSAYIEETARATSALRSGKLTDKEIQELASRLSELYLSTYNGIIEDYSKQHPNASASDVHLVMANALGSSRTFQLMQSFNQELLDTINARMAVMNTVQ